MTDPKEITQLIEDAGGKVDAGSVMRLPDGSGCMTASFPLSKDHWLYQEEEHPPAPFLMGTDDEKRAEWVRKITTATKYAARGATMNGKDMDFDPDALVQNMIVGMLGYNTPDGKTRL